MLRTKLEQIDERTFDDFANDLRVTIPKNFKNKTDMHKALDQLVKLMILELESGQKVSVSLSGFTYDLTLLHLSLPLSKREDRQEVVQ